MGLGKVWPSTVEKLYRFGRYDNFQLDLRIMWSSANKPIQDGGEAKSPLRLNRLSGTN